MARLTQARRENMDGKMRTMKRKKMKERTRRKKGVII
jgi:hypothetical protein